MVEGVQSVFFYVEDMDRAVSFYSGLLGLPVLEEGDTWSAFDCGGVRLGLHLSDVVPKGASTAIVSFRVADAQAAAKQLREAGARVGEVHEEPFGLLVQLEDPDGHGLRLVQPV